MALPLTLLCSPSTTARDRLIRHLLARRPHLAVVVHDMDELLTHSRVRRRVLDASGVREDEQIVLEHGCVSCTLREDVLPTLVRVAQIGQWQEVLLALPVPVLPEGVIDVLRWGQVDGSDVSEHVCLDGVTAVVDPLTLCEQLCGEDLLAERGLAAAQTDGRSLAELLACQLEQADVVALLAVEHVDPTRARTVESLVAHLAPLALRVPVGPQGQRCEEVVTTGRGRPAARADRDRLTLMAYELLDTTPDVATLVWRSAHPLHPGRLHEALDDVVVPVQRGRGHLQLANRPDQVLLFESAGSHVSLGVLADGETVTQPCCELVLTGIGLDIVALQRHLDECIVTEAERCAGAALGPDPFLEALGEATTGQP